MRINFEFVENWTKSEKNELTRGLGKRLPYHDDVLLVKVVCTHRNMYDPRFHFEVVIDTFYDKITFSYSGIEIRSCGQKLRRLILKCMEGITIIQPSAPSSRFKIRRINAA